MHAATLDADRCYRALRSHDARFDGVFFVAVTTTGIYCRPICRAKPPRPQRCRFYRSAVEAEREGFRACFVCRPELAPGASRADATSRLVAAAVERIEAGALDDASLEDLARDLGVSARHLRRAVVAEVGASPIAIAQSRRLALAKQLLHDTESSVTEIALASGFASVRRFNAAFRARFGRAPTSLRRARSGASGEGGAVALTLAYRPPLDWRALTGYLAARATPGVEAVDGATYARTVRVAGGAGWIAVAPIAGRDALRAELHLPREGSLLPLVARQRRAFDLDAQPSVIAEHLAADRVLRRLVARRPGLRVPGAFDPFELAVRAVLGQQVSVAGATTLAGRLAERFGEPIATPLPALRFVSPSAARLAAAREEDVVAIGLTGARARTLVSLARAVVAGDVRLEARADPDGVVASLERVPGIGPWTAAYVAMRALGAPDALPDGDLGLRRALGVASAREVRARAEAWRPWRAYAAVHLWTHDSDGGRS